VAAGAVLAATSTLHVGTGIHLLPMYEPERVAAQLAWLERMSGGRFEYGVGIGYRAPEFDAYGVSRRRRGRRMDGALDCIAELGPSAPRVWTGGFSEPALRRAGRRGLGVLLPQTLSMAQIVAAGEQVREEAAAAGVTVRIGLMRYAWPTDGSDAERAQALRWLDDSSREYWGSWFKLRGEHAFDVPELLDRQLQRGEVNALIGPPEELAAELRRLAEAGVELCVLHLPGDGRLPSRRAAMRTIGEQVLPAAHQVTL
jgi:alkanesulfonate monooxygenase SsuD/methylene tetrahydromethanopterin reductase-like flavin-dependent oxidoreductase (luciferase family)